MMAWIGVLSSLLFCWCQIPIFTFTNLKSFFCNNSSRNPVLLKPPSASDKIHSHACSCISAESARYIACSTKVFPVTYYCAGKVCHLKKLPHFSISAQDFSNGRRLEVVIELAHEARTSSPVHSSLRTTSKEESVICHGLVMWT